MQGVKVEGRRYKPVRQAYTLEDIQAMLAKLAEPARTVVTVAAFTGLRESEIRGLRWEDYTGDEIRVVAQRLAHACRSDQNRRERRKSGAGHSDSARSPGRASEALSRRRIYLRRRAARCSPASRQSVPSCHHPASTGSWKGWHGFRRGLGTNLYRLGVPPKVIQEILRHADVSTTETHYIVVDRTETKVAMKKLERAVGKEWAKAERQQQS